MTGTLARWVSWARRLFIPAALMFLGYSAYRAGGSLEPLFATISIRYLLLAWACWGMAQWVGPFSTVAFAHILALPLAYRELALISILRLPAKYLPGGIWQSVARFTAYGRLDVKPADSLTILIGEHLIALGVSMALGAALLLCIDDTALLRKMAAWTLASALALLAATTFWLVRKRKPAMRTIAWISMAIATTALFWVIAAAAFCIYWSAVFGLHGTNILRVASCYLLSWAVGFVAIFAPQGLGVFEWVAAHLLPSSQPLSVIVTAVAGFRLVTVAGDLGSWTIGAAISRAHRNSVR